MYYKLGWCRECEKDVAIGIYYWGMLTLKCEHCGSELVWDKDLQELEEGQVLVIDEEAIC